jgi:hypothetical protein
MDGSAASAAGAGNISANDGTWGTNRPPGQHQQHCATLGQPAMPMATRQDQ